MSTLSLKTIVKERICREILQPFASSKNVLVLDEFTTKLLSSCCRMQDLVTIGGVVLVEDISKSREPYSLLEAIYFLSPTKESVAHLINDAQKIYKDYNPLRQTNSRVAPGGNNNATCRRYRYGHVFLAEECAEYLFRSIQRDEGTLQYIHTFKELDLCFYPFESKVFTLDLSINNIFCQYFRSPILDAQSSPALDRISSQVASLCGCLNEFPSIRYRGAYPKNRALAMMVQEKLCHLQARNADMRDSIDGSGSQLIILDRGVDVISPLLHELTYQAMVHELLDVENDSFRYTDESTSKRHLFRKKSSVRANSRRRSTFRDRFLSRRKQRSRINSESAAMAQASSDSIFILQEADYIWSQLRHKHIDIARNDFALQFKQFLNRSSEMKQILGKDMRKDMKKLGLLIKQLPQYQKQLHAFVAHDKMINSCLKMYTDSPLANLISTEQDLATGRQDNGAKLKSPETKLFKLIQSDKILPIDKLRLLLLYFLHQQGVVSDEFIQKSFLHAHIPEEKIACIKNLANLGVNFDPAMKHGVNQMSWRKLRVPEYQTSRWTPVVKDIIELATEGKLSETEFPFLVRTKETVPSTPKTLSSARKWHPNQTLRLNERSPSTKLIVFIARGVTFSEIRSAYEVSEEIVQKFRPAWDIYIGSDQLLLPKIFLENLETLTKAPAADSLSKYHKDDKPCSEIRSNSLIITDI